MLKPDPEIDDDWYLWEVEPSVAPLDVPKCDQSSGIGSTKYCHERVQLNLLLDL